MPYFLEYLPVLSVMTQPSGRIRYRYSKVWRSVPEWDVNTYVPVSLNRPWPAYLKEGVMVRLLEQPDWLSGKALLVSAWRLKKAGPGWDIIFDSNKSGCIEIETEYVFEYRPPGSTEWYTIPNIQVGRDKRHGQRFYFEAVQPQPCLEPTGTMVRILDPWYLEGSNVVIHELCAAWFRNEHGGWTKLYETDKTTSPIIFTRKP